MADTTPTTVKVDHALDRWNQLVAERRALIDALPDRHTSDYRRQQWLDAHHQVGCDLLAYLIGFGGITAEGWDAAVALHQEQQAAVFGQPATEVA